MFSPSQYLDHGALGAAMIVMLIAMSVLFRALMWAREIMELVLTRIEHNTAAMARLAERLHNEEGDL